MQRNANLGEFWYLWKRASKFGVGSGTLRMSAIDFMGEITCKGVSEQQHREQSNLGLSNSVCPCGMFNSDPVWKADKNGLEHGISNQTTRASVSMSRTWRTAPWQGTTAWSGCYVCRKNCPMVKKLWSKSARIWVKFWSHWNQQQNFCWLLFRARFLLSVFLSTEKE